MLKKQRAINRAQAKQIHGLKKEARIERKIHKEDVKTIKKQAKTIKKARNAGKPRAPKVKRAKGPKQVVKKQHDKHHSTAKNRYIIPYAITLVFYTDHPTKEEERRRYTDKTIILKLHSPPSKDNPDEVMNALTAYWDYQIKHVFKNVSYEDIEVFWDDIKQTGIVDVRKHKMKGLKFHRNLATKFFQLEEKYLKDVNCVEYFMVASLIDTKNDWKTLTPALFRQQVATANNIEPQQLLDEGYSFDELVEWAKTNNKVKLQAFFPNGEFACAWSQKKQQNTPLSTSLLPKIIVLALTSATTNPFQSK
jgi:hypothetical protein